MVTFLTYAESAKCQEFLHGLCCKNGSLCQPDRNEQFPGCGAYLISLPTSGGDFMALAEKVARTLEKEKRIYA